jgi:hypothetical protein
MPTQTTYRITKQTGFYEELCTLMIALQGVAVSTEYLLHNKAEYAVGDYLTIEAKHLVSKIRLPLYGPIQAAIGSLEPDQIELIVVPDRQAEQSFEHQIAGFQKFVNAIFKPFLVSYHEAHRGEIERKFPSGRDTRPEPWQMGWAVRNAASHNGTVFTSPAQKSISWRGITHSPSDDSKSPLLERINGGDILILLLEMEEARTGNLLSTL